MDTILFSQEVDAADRRKHQDILKEKFPKENNSAMGHFSVSQDKLN
jgi:hypothetical protein